MNEREYLRLLASWDVVDPARGLDDWDERTKLIPVIIAEATRHGGYGEEGDLYDFINNRLHNTEVNTIFLDPQRGRHSRMYGPEIYEVAYPRYVQNFINTEYFQRAFPPAQGAQILESIDLLGALFLEGAEIYLEPFDEYSQSQAGLDQVRIIIHVPREFPIWSPIQFIFHQTGWSQYEEVEVGQEYHAFDGQLVARFMRDPWSMIRRTSWVLTFGQEL